MKIICKTTYPEIEVSGFANPKRPGGKWASGDTVEVTDGNKVIVGHLLRTPEWGIVSEDEKSKFKKVKAEA